MHFISEQTDLRGSRGAGCKSSPLPFAGDLAGWKLEAGDRNTGFARHLFLPGRRLLPALSFSYSYLLQRAWRALVSHFWPGCLYRWLQSCLSFAGHRAAKPQPYLL